MWIYDYDLLTNWTISVRKGGIEQHPQCNGIRDLNQFFLDGCFTALWHLQEDFCRTFGARSSEPDRWNCIDSVEVRPELSAVACFLQHFIVLVRGINSWFLWLRTMTVLRLMWLKHWNGHLLIECYVVLMLVDRYLKIINSISLVKSYVRVIIEN